MKFRHCFALLISLLHTVSIAQTFTAITDPANPIVATNGSGAVGYSGASWVDFDNDGDIDLFVCPENLYRNNGNGTFSIVANHGIGTGLPHSPATGVTWADMDNDGDVDCLYSGASSVLYVNNGKAAGYTFTSVKRGDIASLNNRGWAGAWGDFDNDGFVDLIITHPRGFVGTAIKNPFFKNLGAGEFSRITTGDVVKDLAPYTVPTWYDYDMDGDEDLFIGSGPATANPARDYVFKNMLKESGSASLIRINDNILGTDLVDGQVWNWIDYDLDGDLDAYLTNYSGTGNNNLYRNDNGSYVKMTQVDVGTIVATNNNSLTNIWVDFDNDGDEDCFITRDGTRTCLYYSNNGNGTFTRIDSIPPVKQQYPHIAAVSGDYDNDGDMDLFIVSGSNKDELYRNDQSSGNHWLKVVANGYPLNRTSIGAKVKIKATINGKTYWQFREISAQNSFNGHNSQTAHFGLGNCISIDSLVVEWLSGSKSVLVNVSVDQQISVTENGNKTYLRSVFYGDVVTDQVPMTVKFTNLSFGDSSSMPVSWKWDFNNDGVIDATTQHAEYTYSVPDTYTVALIVSDGVKSDTLIRRDYIAAMPSLPSISFNTTQHHFGVIDVNTEKKDTVVHIMNVGKTSDTLSVSLVYGQTTISTVKPDSALSVFPQSFVIGAKETVAVTFTIFPRKVIRTTPTITYTPKIVVKSKNNNGAKTFEKIMLFKLEGTLVSVERSDGSPDEFALYQNYPNPFNPTTTIRFRLPEQGMVHLTLYDALGREIMKLVEKEFSPGDYSVSLNGEGLSSGLYMYTLRAGNFIQTKKLMMVK